MALDQRRPEVNEPAAVSRAPTARGVPPVALMGPVGLLGVIEVLLAVLLTNNDGSLPALLSEKLATEVR
jgi:hypothetical protein